MEQCFHFQKKKQGEDSTIQAGQLFDGADEQQDEDVHTTLSIHPMMSLTTEQNIIFNTLITNCRR